MRYMFSKSVSDNGYTTLVVLAIPNVSKYDGYYMVSKVTDLKKRIVACVMQKLMIIELSELAKMNECTHEEFITLMSEVSDLIVIPFEKELDEMIQKYKTTDNGEQK